MVHDRKQVLPGATVGVLGSGQLGRMFAIAARRMGYRVHTLSPDVDTPTGQVADKEIVAAYEELNSVRYFARNVDVVTFEFENVPAATAAAAAEYAPVRPAGEVLHITQHRLREKNFLSGNGFPVAAYHPVRGQAELEAALSRTGYPAILKTAGFGYDGKGQIRIASAQCVPRLGDAAATEGAEEYVLEELVQFEREISVVAARETDGAFAHYGAVENTHCNGILDLTVAPAGIDDRVAREAVEITRGIMEKLDAVGVLCVEFFLKTNGTLLVNELAPRPHNSGHFSFDACATSQFEQQLRAVCNLPLGSTRLLAPAAMVNLLGDLWMEGEPDWASALALPDVKLHLYGKLEARAGRKMGHLTALGETPEAAARLAVRGREALRRSGGRNRKR
jgi:5-(carboxyamino)imidazole ribonucleotide synthase